MNIETLYQGFDGLDVAFQGCIPEPLCERLEGAKEAARDGRQPVLVEWRGESFHVQGAGAQGGFAYVVDTGPDGAKWFFAKGQARTGWNIRVSCASMALACHGYTGVRDRLYGFLEAIGADVVDESISRVDFAVDLLAPGLTLDECAFVMHSHTGWQKRRDESDVDGAGGKPGRVTYLRIGAMPNRQVVIYDKRADVIQKRKTYWWEIWNAGRVDKLDPKDREGSRVWRVEVRAGKDHLKKWGITSWEDLEARAGDVMRAALDAIRYTIPNADSNRSRWPDHPIWQAARAAVSSDLLEMTSGATPERVRAVYVEELQAQMQALLTGLAASYATALQVPANGYTDVANRVRRDIAEMADADPEEWARKVARAKAKYKLIFWGRNGQSGQAAGGYRPAGGGERLRCAGDQARRAGGAAEYRAGVD